MRLLLFFILGYVIRTSGLQPSTVIANQLPGQLVYTDIRTIIIGIKMF